MAGGYRSHEARWIGGALQVPPSVLGGYRSFEALWLGGASSAFSVVPPIVPTQVNAGAGILRKKHPILDDEIIIILVSQHLSKTFYKKDN